MISFDSVKKVSFYMYILSAFSLAGTCALYSFYSVFNFGVIPNAIITTISWCFDLIFNSLNFLGFFIRPSTVKIVVEMFVFYYLIKLNFKFFIVTIKIGRFLYDYVTSLKGMIFGAIIKIFGL